MEFKQTSIKVIVRRFSELQFVFSQTTTEKRIKVCIFCLAIVRQGQAEKLSKAEKKYLATTYKPFFSSLWMSLYATNKYRAPLIGGPQVA